MKKIMSLILVSFVFISCSKGGDQRLEEQEEIKARGQVNAQNQNQQEWAEKMEKDLNKRKFFITAIEGIFTGELTVNDIDFVIKTEMIPSIPIVFSDRTRTLDEINFELENLTLTVNVKMENPRIINSAVSCTIEKHRPDIKQGLIKMLSTSCKNIFKLMLSDNLEESEFTEALKRSKELAENVTNNEITQIDILKGSFESGASTQTYQFSLTRNQ